MMRCLKTRSSQRIVQIRLEIVQRKKQIIQKKVKTRSEGRCKTARRKRPHGEAHDGNRERTVRRALGVPNTSARLHQTSRLVNQYKHVCAEMCPLTTRHVANAEVAAGEQECRALLKELWRDAHPKAETEHLKQRME